MKNRIPTALLLFSGIILLAYTCLRAYLLSMTHDESGSFLYWADLKLFTCFFVPGQWPDANLHWLYVFFMRISVALFGEAEWAIRLPSLFSHIAYIFFSWKILRLFSENKWGILAGFILLNVNPYLLEFFSLARGYGMALAFMMASIYFFGKWLKTKNNLALAFSFSAAIFGTLANLTQLNYFAALFGLFVVFVFWRKFFRKKNILSKSVLVAALSTTILSVLLARPIHQLKSNGKLYYGADSFYETFTTLWTNSLYGVKPYFPYFSEIIGGLFLSVFISAVFYHFISFFKNIDDPKKCFSFWLTLLPLVILAGTVVQYHLFGTPYLHYRTALLFWPLLVLPISFLFNEICDAKRWAYFRLFPLLIVFSILVHAFFSFNLTHSREWWFDQYTKEAMIYVDDNFSEYKFNMGCSWVFQPSVTYYVNKFGINMTEEVVYTKKVSSELKYDLYFVRVEDLSKIHGDYILEKKFSYGTHLMKRKGMVKK